jgi:hypothetical protein
MHFPRFLAEDGGAETLSQKEMEDTDEELGVVQNCDAVDSRGNLLAGAIPVHLDDDF